MAEHRARIQWQRSGEDFSYETYSRNHFWAFADGIQVPASAAPAFLGDPGRVDPEEAFVAALSSCHMLSFLAIASRKRFVVETYEDNAVGFLEEGNSGKLAMTRVILRPKVTFGGERVPTADQAARMHHQAHEECFIANSVNTEVSVEHG